MKNHADKTRAALLAGFGLLELIIAIGVVGVSLFALLGAGQIAQRAVADSSRRLQAVYLFEEGMEALRVMRDGAWSNIASLEINQPYILAFVSGLWEATTTPQSIEGIFNRTFTLREVFRDADDNIAASGTFDPGMRKVEMSVSWNLRGAASAINGTSFLANLFLE